MRSRLCRFGVITAVVLAAFVGGALFQKHITVGRVKRSLGLAPTVNPGQDGNAIKITRVSSIPNPQTAEYPECIAFFEARSERNASTNDLAARIILAFTVFKDRKYTPAAYITPGTGVRGELIPWDDAPKSIRRTPIADEVSELGSSVYWVKSWNPPFGGETAPANETVARLLALGTDTVYLRDRKRVALVSRHTLLNPVIWAKNRDSNLEVISAFASRLRSAGIDLYVAFFPGETSLFADQILGPEFHPEKAAPANEDVLAFVADLEARGVKTIDLNSVFLAHREFPWEGQTFPITLPNEPHWSSFGAKLAARTIADRIRRDHPDYQPASPERVTETVSLIEHAGNLSFQSRIISLTGPLPPAPTPLFRLKGPPELFETSSPQASVWILSESNGSIFSEDNAGFQAHLARELGTPAHSIISFGSVHTRAGIEFFKQGGLKHAKVVVLIAEERFAAMPWRDW